MCDIVVRQGRWRGYAQEGHGCRGRPGYDGRFCREAIDGEGSDECEVTDRAE